MDRDDLDHGAAPVGGALRRRRGVALDLVAAAPAERRARLQRGPAVRADRLRRQPGRRDAGQRGGDEHEAGDHQPGEKDASVHLRRPP